MATINVTDLGDLQTDYVTFMSFDQTDRILYLKEQSHQKPVLGGLVFDQGPVDIVIFYALHELVRKIWEAIRVCRCFGTNEDVEKVMCVSVVAGTAVGFIRVAFADDPPSDHAGFLIHRALLAFVKAYLQAHTTLECTRCGLPLCGMTSLCGPGQRRDV
jgi:hypothetical protein